jgi:hypothetical protein
MFLVKMDFNFTIYNKPQNYEISSLQANEIRLGMKISEGGIN